jgi:hypothetical protein
VATPVSNIVIASASEAIQQHSPLVIARLDRAIQYAAPEQMMSGSLEYWMPRMRGA